MLSRSRTMLNITKVKVTKLTSNLNNRIMFAFTNEEHRKYKYTQWVNGKGDSRATTFMTSPEMPSPRFKQF